jgi:hypothetical protein
MQNVNVERMSTENIVPQAKKVFLKRIKKQSLNGNVQIFCTQIVSCPSNHRCPVINYVHRWGWAVRRREVNWHRVMWYENICSVGAAAMYGAQGEKHDELRRREGLARYLTD